ncbi:hypothetical protein DFH28DRAFT_1083085 [Melampsora americana]|nr:hypothetical protein DFH28DRAFT_1083085 [Melampsora americana]
MGYFPASPSHPRTAFSIRLLLFHHILWKYCSVRMQGFSLALEEYLDAKNPLMLSTKTGRPREWRKPLTYAVRAHRQVLSLIRRKETEILQLSQLEQLASNCPRCFGPPVDKTPDPDEPHIILCVDGNFQHKRHLAASHEIPGHNPEPPELFMDPERVDKMAVAMAGGRGTRNPQLDELVDPCTDKHTAADDIRGKRSFPGMDETGLVVMACRHDHIIRFVNLVQSGEKPELLRTCPH